MIVDRATLVERVATAISRSAANRPRKEGTIMRFRRYAEAAIDAMSDHDQGADRATLERVERGLTVLADRENWTGHGLEALAAGPLIYGHLDPLELAAEMAGLLRGLLAEGEEAPSEDLRVAVTTLRDIAAGRDTAEEMQQMARDVLAVMSPQLAEGEESREPAKRFALTDDEPEGSGPFGF